MIPYYCLIGIPLLFAFGYELYFEKYGVSEKKNYTILIFYVIYFILLAFRSKNIGFDTVRYLSQYESMYDITLKDILRRDDIGYYLFTKVLSVFFKDGQWLLAIVAAITTIPFAYLYYKETKNSLVTIALLMVLPTFQMNFSGLRQAIAIALVVPAVYLVKKKELKKSALVVILAMMFHSSAFIILIIYPLYHCTIKIKHMLIIAPIGLIIYKYNTQIYLFMATRMGDKFEERYAFATETGAVTMLIVFFLFTIYAFVFVKGSLLTKEQNGFRNFLLAALFIQLFAPVNSIAMRMGYYFMPFIPIVVTQSTKYLKIKDKRIRWCLSVAIYMLFTIYYIDKSLDVDSLGIYPYELFTTERMM